MNPAIISSMVVAASARHEEYRPATTHELGLALIIVSAFIVYTAVLAYFAAKRDNILILVIGMIAPPFIFGLILLIAT